MDDHDEEKRTVQKLFVRSGKSDAELALNVLKLLNNTKHRAASLRQQGCQLFSKH